MKWMALWLVPLVAAAQVEDGSFPKTEAVGEELRQLEQTPAVVEYRRISGQIDEIQQEQQKRADALHKKLREIRESDAFKEYAGKREALEGRRSNEWELERRAMAEAARKIYSERHAEIRGVAKAELAQAAKLGFDALTYPQVDGSTSTGPLSVIVACRVLNVPYEWIYPEPTGHPWRNQPDVSAYLLPMAATSYRRGEYELSLAALRVVAKPDRREQERVAMMINSLLAASTSTHDAYVNLIEAKSDLSLVARAASESERKLAEQKGVTLKLEPIARDAFVLLVNRKNPLRNLTRQQVREIYEEKIADWKDVGGAEGKIRPFRREPDSGSRELFDALVMQGQALPEGARFAPLYADSMGGPFSQLTRQAEGLAYSVYYYEHFMAASPFTQTIAIDGVEPTPESIASGHYPWVTPVYAAYRDGEPPDSAGRKLLEWLLSPEGQAVVRESGYVPAH